MRDKTERIIKDWSPVCDAEVSIAVVGGAWKPTILAMLEEHGILRFGELSRLLEGTTPRVLTRQLRELEEDGLVIRTVHRQVPPKVEYELSDVGRSASPLLAELTRWGRAYASPHRTAASSVSGE